MMRGEVGKEALKKEIDNRGIFMTSHITLSGVPSYNRSEYIQIVSSYPTIPVLCDTIKVSNLCHLMR